VKKKVNPTLDRDQQILNRLARIEHKVDSFDRTQAFSLRADEEKHFDSVKKIFKNGKRRAQVYLAANGDRSVNEIATHLGMKRPNVSKELSVLDEEGLLEIVNQNGGTTYWGKTSLDRTLRISLFLKTAYSLGPDGKETLGKKK
jgi:DNA-binding transcriptional ArsR family regulator